MRFLILFSICFAWLVRPVQAQERVRNVRIRAVDSTQLEIRYDLPNARPGDSVYFQMRSRLRGALLILPDFVRGDVGKGILAGSDRRILWNALANGYSLNEEVRAVVLVKAGPLPTPTVATAPTPNPTRQPQPADNPPRQPTPTPAPVPPPIQDRTTAPASTSATTTAPPVAVTPAPDRTTRPDVSTAPADRPDTSTTTIPAQPSGQPAVSTPSQDREMPSTDVKSAPAQTPEPQRRTEPTDQSNVKSNDALRSTPKRYAGPAWALLSAVAPGVGNIFVQTPRPKVGLRPLLAVGCYGLVAYGIYERQNARTVYAQYEQQRSLTVAEPYYQRANGHHQRYFAATRGAVAIAAIDVLCTFLRGTRNQQTGRVVRDPETVTLRPGVQAGQPTMVMRYSF